MKPLKTRPIAAMLAILAVMILAFAGTRTTRARPDWTASGPTSTAGMTIRKRDHLGPQNVVKTAKVSFDKTLTDALGKAHRVQIDKVEYLKTPGIRYYARIDGQSRDIAYLDLRAANVKLVNVEGSRASQNFYQVLSAGENADSFWTGNTLLDETTHVSGMRNAAPFSLRQKQTDALSFALRTIDPIHLLGLKPAQVFHNDDGGIKPADPIRPPDWGNIFPPIEVLFKCKINSKNLKHCGEGCDIQQPPEDAEAWGSLGISAKKECKQQSGCLWCAGMCCKSSACTSDTNPEPIIDCTVSAGS